MANFEPAGSLTLSKPRISPSVLVLTIQGGYGVFDVRSKTMHRLNPTAALIVELADGTRTVDEIVETISQVIGRDKATRSTRWIARAVEQKLLVESDESSEIKAETLDAPKISELASELRWADDVQSAYLLQKHAAELAPEDPYQWYRLGELAHIVGERSVARAAYETYFEKHPEDAEVGHILIALKDEPLPPRASDACIDQIYSRFAEFYESNMCDELAYRAPEHLAAAFGQWLKDSKNLFAVDLGCGTGLFGRKIRPHCRRLLGIDLSQAMLEKAGQIGVYDALESAELTDWLTRYSGEPFELITCCDTLIYFGDLTNVLSSAMSCLRPGGKMGFTLEKSDKAPFRLGDSGRFRHHRSHIQAAAKAAGANVDRIAEKVLRREYGEDVLGLVTVLTKPEK